jgi:hypothetical protein
MADFIKSSNFLSKGGAFYQKLDPSAKSWSFWQKAHPFGQKLQLSIRRWTDLSEAPTN